MESDIAEDMKRRAGEFFEEKGFSAPFPKTFSKKKTHGHENPWVFCFRLGNGIISTSPFDFYQLRKRYDRREHGGGYYPLF